MTFRKNDVLVEGCGATDIWRCVPRAEIHILVRYWDIDALDQRLPHLFCANKRLHKERSG